jgi:hypothetical protein
MSRSVPSRREGVGEATIHDSTGAFNTANGWRSGLCFLHAGLGIPPGAERGDQSLRASNPHKKSMPGSPARGWGQHGTWSRRRRMRSRRVSHASGPLQSRLRSCLPKPPLPRPSPRTTLEASPSPIPRGMSRPRWAALRLAESRSGRLLQRAGDAAIAAGEGWPPAEACSRGDGAKKAL